MILERTQSVFGRSLVQVFKIADSKSFLKSKAIKTKKIRSTVVEGNYFRSKKNNSSSYHANFLSQVIISRFKRSRMLDLEIQKKNHYYNYIWSRKSYEMLFVFTLYSEYQLFFSSCFYCRYVYLGGKIQMVSYVPIEGYSFQFFRYVAGSYILHTKRYNILYIIKIQCTSLNCKKS